MKQNKTGGQYDEMKKLIHKQNQTNVIKHAEGEGLTQEPKQQNGGLGTVARCINRIKSHWEITNKHPPLKTEVEEAINALKRNKSPGVTKYVEVIRDGERSLRCLPCFDN